MTTKKYAKINKNGNLVTKLVIEGKFRDDKRNSKSIILKESGLFKTNARIKPKVIVKRNLKGGS